jgi:hypothetical protein
MKNALVFTGLFLLVLGSHARADVFNMGPGLTSLDTVYVGDAGNAPDPTTGFGEVDYNYNIGKCDVTTAQYVEFLNAKAQTDSYPGLWWQDMPTDCGILRGGGLEPGDPYFYSVAPGWENRPVTDVTAWNAMRFANWLSNGQGDGDTETGSYTLAGSNGVGPISRNRGATWYVPSMDEWYKAAYYKGEGTDAGYWLYPTQSDTAPGNQLPDPGNSANYYNNGYTVGNPYYTTPVGAFSNSPSSYGTFDQAGNVRQWSDTLHAVSPSGLAYYLTAGTMYADPISLLSSAGEGFHENSYFTDPGLGFRVAEAVPEPPSRMVMLVPLLFLSIPLAGKPLRRRLRSASRGASWLTALALMAGILFLSQGAVGHVPYERSPIN